MISLGFLQTVLVISAAASTVAFDVLKREANMSVWPSNLASDVHDSSWPDWANTTIRWSTYDAPTFDSVFIPTTPEDLASGLAYLSSNNISFLAKSGGHGYSPTLEVIQDATMISMENFTTLQLNEDNTVTMGSATLFSDLVLFLEGVGRELTVGSCPCVGATGAMLGGGLGRLQGLYGLTSDSLLSVKMALSNGTLIEASADQNSDLFWGLRGAGQNFGIVYESTLQTHTPASSNVHYNANLYFNGTALEPVLAIMNNLTAAGLDARLSLIPFFSISTTFETEFVINLVYSGTQDEGHAYAELFAPLATIFEESMVSWSELFSAAVDGYVNVACTKGISYNMRSIITRTLDIPTFRAMTDSLAVLIQAYPAAAASVIMVETFPTQGVAAFPDNYTAFPHRSDFQSNTEFVMNYADGTDDATAAAVDAWSAKWRDTLAKPNISGYDAMYIYQNYAHNDEPLSAIYGNQTWRHEKLTTLKNEFDSPGLFDGYHAIPQTLSAWT